MKRNDFKIGVALGGGGAAGLAYAGVVKELIAAGIRFDCIAGTSAGSAIGAALAAGRLDEFVEIMTTMSRSRAFRLIDPVWRREGLIGGRRAIEYIESAVGGSDRLVEDLDIPFAAVATDLNTGEEVVIDRGPVTDAIRASIAIPGVFRPHMLEGRVLVDGGLSDPIPVSVARGLGAHFVIGVSILRLRGVLRDAAPLGILAGAVNYPGTPEWPAPDIAEEETPGDEDEPMGILDVLAKGSAVVQAAIAGARLREDPADFFVSPRAEGIGVFELMRMAEAFECGRAAALRALPGLREALSRARRHHANPLWRFFHERRRQARKPKAYKRQDQGLGSMPVT